MAELEHAFKFNDAVLRHLTVLKKKADTGPSSMMKSVDREDARKTEGKDVIVYLLPVLDDFERALRSMETTGDVASLKEGVQLIQQKLKNTLTQKGLKEMESIGSAFDPEVHEAITNIPAPADDMKGKVMDEMEKGYFLNDKVIRFAKVVVGA